MEVVKKWAMSPRIPIARYHVSAAFANSTFNHRQGLLSITLAAIAITCLSCVCEVVVEEVGESKKVTIIDYLYEGNYIRTRT